MAPDLPIGFLPKLSNLIKLLIQIYQRPTNVATCGVIRWVKIIISFVLPSSFVDLCQRIQVIKEHGDNNYEPHQ